MSRYERSTLMVHVLDTEKVKPLLDEVYRALYGEEPGDYRVDEAVIEMADTEKGVGVALVCSEGVGWQATKYNCLPVQCNGGHTELPLHPDLIPVREEMVDLGEFIRSFGARLETNWSLWHHAISRARAEESA